MTLFFRLAQKCGNLVGDIGEEELYVKYRKSKDLLSYLCKEYTKDCVKKAKQELWYGKMFEHGSSVLFVAIFLKVFHN